MSPGCRLQKWQSMSAWSELEWPIHEGGTPYTTDLAGVLDGAKTLRDHVYEALKRHPDRWVLVYFGQSGSLGRQKHPGVRLHATCEAQHYRIYARSTKDATPEQLTEQASLLPKPSFDIPRELWLTRMQFPKIDMTDSGFNWTQEELDEATRLAMSALYQRESIHKMMRRKSAALRETNT